MPQYCFPNCIPDSVEIHRAPKPFPIPIAFQVGPQSGSKCECQLQVGPTTTCSRGSPKEHKGTNAPSARPRPLQPHPFKPAVPAFLVKVSLAPYNYQKLTYVCRCTQVHTGGRHLVTFEPHTLQDLTADIRAPSCHLNLDTCWHPHAFCTWGCELCPLIRKCSRTLRCWLTRCCSSWHPWFCVPPPNVVGYSSAFRGSLVLQ